MVCAILEGRKTQTRRIVRDSNSLGNWKPSQCDMTQAWVDQGPSPAGNPGPYLKAPVTAHPDDLVDRIYSRDWSGDRLWVRETHHTFAHGDPTAARGIRTHQVVYRADPDSDQWDRVKWTPSIFMPRWASRITLEITGVRVERLQEISDGDAHAEGISEEAARSLPLPGRGNEPTRAETVPRDVYSVLWDDINGAGSWDANQWVWVFEFKTL